MPRNRLVIVVAIAIACAGIGHFLWKPSPSSSVPPRPPPIPKAPEPPPPPPEAPSKPADDIGKVLSTLEKEGLIHFAQEVRAGDLVLPRLSVEATMAQKDAYPEDETLQFHELLLKWLSKEIDSMADCDVAAFREHVELLADLSDRMRAAMGYRNLVAATVLRSALACALMARAASPHPIDSSCVGLARSLRDRRTTGKDLLRCLQHDLGAGFPMPSAAPFPDDEVSLMSAMYRGLGGTVGGGGNDEVAGQLALCEDHFSVLRLHAFDPRGFMGAIVVAQVHLEGALGLLEIRAASGALPTDPEVLRGLAHTHVQAIRDKRTLLLSGKPIDAMLYQACEREVRRDDRHGGLFGLDW